MAGGVRSSLLHTTTFPTSFSGDLSPLASLIVEFFGLSRSVLLRIRKCVADLDFASPDLLVLFVGLFGGVGFSGGCGGSARILKLLCDLGVW
jgi:hypothetical protein